MYGKWTFNIAVISSPLTETLIFDFVPKVWTDYCKIELSTEFNTYFLKSKYVYVA